MLNPSPNKNSQQLTDLARGGGAKGYEHPVKWERGPVVASSSRYPRVRGSIPPLGTLGNVSENQFLGSTQAM